MVLLRHLRAIKAVGLKEYARQVWLLGAFIGGTFVGEDAYGNRYYEINDRPKGLPFYRKRYVELAKGSDEASKVPADWHGWLHYTSDDAPSKNSEAYVYPEWSVGKTGHVENLTGTPQRYVPYSTTDEKVHCWSPSNLDASRAFILGNPALSYFSYSYNKRARPVLPTR